MKELRSRRNAALVGVWLLVSCACGADPNEQARREAPGLVASGTEASPSKGETSSSLAAAGDKRVEDDLLARPGDVDFAYHGAKLIDFASDAAARFTLGGWQTQAGGRVDVDGTRGTLIPTTVGRIIVPFDAPGRYTLRLGLRAVGSGDLTVYLDDQTVASGKLQPGTGVTVVDVPIATDRAGDRTIQLRATKVGKLAGGREGSMLITHAWIIREGASLVEPADYPHVDKGSVVLPAGWAMTVDAIARKGAELHAVASGGEISVRVRNDGAGKGASATGSDVRLSLDPSAGQVVRAEVEAKGAAATLTSLGIESAATACRERPAPAKNVLVYLIDTLRADHVHAINSTTRVRTPGMDGLARGAATFTDAHSHENWTKPSVASLLSGLLPWQHQATTGDAVVPANVTLLSERLSDAGFYTGSFIANGYVSDKFGFKQGWSTYRNYIREGRRTQANFVASDVLDWLDKRPKDKPFFLYVHTIDPHVPYIPPDDVVRTYDPDPYQGPVNFLRDRLLLENIKMGKVHVNERDKVRLEALYDSEITFHDVHMNAIFDGLARRGLAENTVVILTADHGEELFDHGSVGHGHSVWEELLHVPFLVRIPGLTDGGAVLDAPIGHADAVPTVLDALGMKVPADLPGRSLVPLLACGEATPRHVVSGFMDGWRTVVAGSWKLVHRSVSKYALYDLAHDPTESHDVAADHPIAVRYMRGMLGSSLDATSSARADAPQIKQKKTTIDATTAAQLRALGYVGTDKH